MRDIELLGVVTPRSLVEGGLAVMILGGGTNGHLNLPGVPGVVKSSSISTAVSADRPFQTCTSLPPPPEFWRYLNFPRASSAL